MDNLNDLKTIWHTAKTDSLPGSDEMVRTIKKFRSQKLLKIALLVVVAILLVAIMVLVMFTYRSTMLTTRLGEIGIVIAGLILIITNINSLIRFYKLKDSSNKDFIGFLEHTRKRRLFYHKKTQVVALTFCSLGLALYIFEAVYKDTLLCIVSYSLLGAYIAALWLIIRPRLFKKQAKKLDEEIKRIETIAKQIKTIENEL
jgi:amino acid transporter